MEPECSSKILSILEKNSKLTPRDIAAMIGIDEESVLNEMVRMEQEKIICGYHTMINWDKAPDEKVTALIGVKISPVRGEGFDRIAERFSRFDEVTSVYLISGSSSDLILSIEARSLHEVSHFVYDKIAPMETVLSTATYFVLKKYKDHNVSFADPDKGADERNKITP